MSPCCRCTRLLSALVLLFSAMLLAGWLTTGLAAQDSSKPPPKKEEEEELPKAAKQSGKKPKEEEEETSKPKRRVPKVGDEEVEEKQPRPAAKDKAAAPVTDLEREAERAKNTVAAELFRGLAKPHDVAVLPSGRRVPVEPLPEYIGPNPRFNGTLTLKPFTPQWKTGRTFTARRGDLNAVDPYENIALNKVSEFLKSGLEQEPATSAKYLSRLEMLKVAEKVLVSVLSFHLSAVERGVRVGDAWAPVEKEVGERLKTVQLDQLRALTSAKDWNVAFDLATRLAEKYRKVAEVQVEIAQLLAAHAQNAIQTQDYGEVRRRLLVLEELFPNSAEIEPVRKELRKQAQVLAEKAHEEADKGNTKEAISILQTAEGIYPQLPGLHDYYLRLNQKYPVLYVGVRDLPVNLSPATAYTDSEKQAVELLYESLVKLTYTPALGQRYECELAGDMPKLVPLGRRFGLVRNACWSDGKPLTAADIRHTVRLLSDPQFPGRIPEWADLLQGGAVVDQGDARHISLTLRQGFLDPLSLMDFKILPQVLSRRADDPDFAKAPVGSGPYRFDREKSRPGEDVAFSANPYYETRPGRTGLPRVREIHFVRSETPKGDFQFGKLHLLLDLPASRYREMESVPDVTLFHARNRRIYFLAVNHRRTPLKNQALRRAIAHAINRDQILKEKLRDGYDFHRPLNGPYPPGSWAAKPGLEPDPYKPDLAKAQAEKAKNERALQAKLTLKYPDNDPAVAGACDQLRAQVAAVGVTLELIARSPRDLRRDVEEVNDYDLAYYSYDYPTEAFWLWPLLDPQAAYPGGRNYLGYVNDDVLTGLFRKIMNRRDFTVVQGLTHQIHELLLEQMPLIPLWQLDTLYAIHNSVVTPGRLDPLLIFTDVEKWSLEKK